MNSYPNSQYYQKLCAMRAIHTPAGVEQAVPVVGPLPCRLAAHELLKNPILNRNMQAYLARRPEDAQRIFNIVSLKVDNPPKLTDFKPAEPGATYRPRICFIASIMDPAFWKVTKETWKADCYFIVEGNPEAIAYQFQNVDMTAWIMEPDFHFILGYAGEDIIAPMQVVLRQTRYAGKILLSQVITPMKGEGIADHWVDYAFQLTEFVRKTVDHVLFNFGNIDDSIEGFRSTFDNSERISTSGGISELENLHKGKPIVVVGAGPSLDHDIELLARNCDKFIIVAVDAAIKPLVKAGCRIDYVTTIERFSGLQHKFFEDVPEQAAELICYPVVHKDVIKYYPGIVRFSYRNYAWYAYFEKNWPMGVLESGGCAAHLAAKLAHHMGADITILVGCDMTYEKHPTEEKWRSHCLNGAYEDWNEYKTFDQIRTAPEYWGFFDIEANDGSQVKTHTIYHQWAKEFSSFLLANQNWCCVTTSAKGIKTPRLEYVSLQELVNVAQPIDTEKRYPANMRAMAPLDHTILAANIKGIQQTIDTVVETLAVLTKHPDEPQPEILQLALDILYKKFAYDTLYTAFYIQNCAMEYFKAEAKWYALPDGDLGDQHWDQRVWAVLGIYQALQNVGAKTVKVLESVT